MGTRAFEERVRQRLRGRASAPRGTVPEAAMGRAWSDSRARVEGAMVAELRRELRRRARVEGAEAEFRFVGDPQPAAGDAGATWRVGRSETAPQGDRGHE
jgi:hypothetical protein